MDLVRYTAVADLIDVFGMMRFELASVIDADFSIVACWKSRVDGGGNCVFSMFLWLYER